ncbi:hypothetical protein KLQUMMO235M1_26175 [Klebsiella quasipneumoniae subsp. quasipneumoniae]
MPGILMKNIHYQTQFIPFHNIKICLKQLPTFIKQCHVHSFAALYFYHNHQRGLFKEIINFRFSLKEDLRPALKCRE